MPEVRCVFVHGWAMNSSVWQSFIKTLPDYIESVCIDLPGHGEFNQLKFSNLNELSQHLDQQIDVSDTPTIWVGWSLGALPVLQLAKRSAEKVSAIFNIASNPAFVTTDDWQYGVDASVFDLFADNLVANTDKTIQRFLSLQVQGMDNSREVLRLLRQSISARGLPTAEALSSGLDVLKQTDLRPMLSELTQPLCWNLGERDTLVPAALDQYLSCQSGVKSHIIAGAAHLPFVSHADRVRQLLLDFIHDQFRLDNQ